MDKSIHQLEIATEIIDERERQDAMHNNSMNSAGTWYRVLGEEVDEVAEALIDGDIEHAREELIQVAAVAMAIVEAIDDGRV